jgi:3-isopropylmalate/(R)-2-methylmalate dehydratase small subunit
MESKFTGRVYVVRDNIDTDQIIPAQFLNLVPTIEEEYQKLGSYAMYGLPDSLYPVRFIAEGAMDTEYPILLAGRNFGCGSSREHAPIALGAAETQFVVAEGFARIFFRNCVATGEVYPVECVDRLCDIFSTGDFAAIDIDNNTITHLASGKSYSLKPLGEVRPVVDAGGIFAYARQTGMIPKAV